MSWKTIFLNIYLKSFIYFWNFSQDLELLELFLNLFLSYDTFVARVWYVSSIFMNTKECLKRPKILVYWFLYLIFCKYECCDANNVKFYLPTYNHVFALIKKRHVQRLLYIFFIFWWSIAPFIDAYFYNIFS